MAKRKQVDDAEIVRVTKGWASILRRHQREVSRALKAGEIEKMTCEEDGWSALLEALRAAAQLLEWFAKERASRL